MHANIIKRPKQALFLNFILKIESILANENDFCTWGRNSRVSEFELTLVL